MADLAPDMPLLGAGVLVTRPKSQAAGLADALSNLGAKVWQYSAITIEDPESWAEVDSVLANIHQFDWIVFTSQNGVRKLIRRLRHVLGSPAAVPLAAKPTVSARLAAVGPATAAELTRHGLSAHLTPPVAHAESLQTALLSAVAPGSNVLIVRPRVAAADLATPLRAAGCAVTECVVYQTGAGSGNLVEVQSALANGLIHYVTFASGSAVTKLMKALGGSAALGRAQIACIGPKTADAARAAGLAVAVTAPMATAGALAVAVAAHYRGQNGADIDQADNGGER